MAFSLSIAIAGSSPNYSYNHPGWARLEQALQLGNRGGESASVKTFQGVSPPK